MLRRQLASLPEIAQNLPSTVSPDKFRNVVITAANLTPGLLNADRKSLLGACVKCAADGLIPDGREAALVMFGQQVQYMPMVGGILKRAFGDGWSVTLSDVAAVPDRTITADDVGTTIKGRKGSRQARIKEASE